MKTKTQKHALSGDTVMLAATLKRLENKTTPGNRLREWLCVELRRELALRAASATAQCSSL